MSDEMFASDAVAGSVLKRVAHYPGVGSSPESFCPIGQAASGVGRAVAVRGLTKSYGDVPVLKGIDLTANQGDVISIIGASGSGKSTALRCINLLETPDAGEIEICGEVVRMRSGSHGRNGPADRHQIERIRRTAGMVFQSFNLWSHFTVLQNVIEAPIHVLQKPRKEAIDHALHLLEKVGLSDKLNHYPSRLSGGQQQRAAIARTLAMQPKVMLFDEPTSALDPELVGEVLRVIRGLVEEGRTMLLVTHEMRFAREVSDKVVFLHQGRVEEEGAPDQLFNQPVSDQTRKFLRQQF
ncbi:ATP-binding cassette domain-containing protein [Caballeronia sp. SEWSISQ10-4 2]|uniref:ABC transporter ATP-binding protein n=1 Tax=Caballeronia sp. SEWSISQ10-4 2 TaxID=2937438 RepID=UPI002654817D|nr:ATP-binding cassette domain-containing protein [Caballeronia sp. SEWSISQ10-4 2]MDN7177195.1 ATP-binding cassette domain-containing protein [Caballeronia sp. SEWSISQ10-4 2]